MTKSAKADRPERIPVAGPRNVLTVANKDPNFEYRFVNDTGDRIERFKAGGWEVVTSEDEVGDKKVDRGTKLGSAITKAVGGQVTAVLMRIPKEWYMEDQAAKQAEIDALEATMRQTSNENYGNVEIQRHRS